MTEAWSVGGELGCYYFAVGDHMGHEMLVSDEHLHKCFVAPRELFNDGA